MGGGPEILSIFPALIKRAATIALKLVCTRIVVKRDTYSSVSMYIVVVNLASRPPQFLGSASSAPD